MEYAETTRLGRRSVGESKHELRRWVRGGEEEGGDGRGDETDRERALRDNRLGEARDKDAAHDERRARPLHGAHPGAQHDDGDDAREEGDGGVEDGVEDVTPLGHRDVVERLRRPVEERRQHQHARRSPVPHAKPSAVRCGRGLDCGEKWVAPGVGPDEARAQHPSTPHERLRPVTDQANEERLLRRRPGVYDHLLPCEREADAREREDDEPQHRPALYRAEARPFHPLGAREQRLGRGRGGGHRHRGANVGHVASSARPARRGWLGAVTRNNYATTEKGTSAAAARAA